MATRLLVTKDLAAGATSASIFIKGDAPNFAFMATGNFTGSVSLQHSPDNIGVADADASWDTLGTITDDDTIEITHPLRRIRISGTHTGSPATVSMLADIKAPRYGRDPVVTS